MDLATANITVNGSAAYRKGEYFWKEIQLQNPDNSGAPLWAPVTVAENGNTVATKHQFVPKTPEVFTYDFDGNLLTDGRWQYTWDGENRLIKMESTDTVAPQMVLKFEYDSQGRRIRKQVWNGHDTTVAPASDLRFVYDGWNLIAPAVRVQYIGNTNGSKHR